MYKIAKAYPHMETRHPALDYLRYAYEVLNAMYSKIPLPNPIGDAANTLGLMGESTVPEIIEALQKEQMAHEAQLLGGYIDRKLQHYRQVPYPFASEMTIDTTGFESVYALAKLRGFGELVEKSQRASLASRGLQPLWYFYGSDNRMMGESYWNLGYETQLGAWQQQDYLMHFSNEDQPDFADSMRSTYGAYLAGWANINSGQIDNHPANIGAASWQWQSEGGQPSWPCLPLIEGTSWWAWSGEAELGFWGALRMATVNVVQDPVVGLFAYGGEVELVEGKYVVKPKDGLQRRLTFFNIGAATKRARPPTVDSSSLASSRLPRPTNDVIVESDGLQRSPTKRSRTAAKALVAPATPSGHDTTPATPATPTKTASTRAVPSITAPLTTTVPEYVARICGILDGHVDTLAAALSIVYEAEDLPAPPSI
ncbi:hypothetical protein SEUCBS139899_003395 [Sporothrix eucalyptigena]